MRKPVRPTDWLYLVVSFALSYWLIEAQRRDLSASDIRLLVWHRMSKAVRSVNIALMEIELRLVKMCDYELERRKY